MHQHVKKTRQRVIGRAHIVSIVALPALLAAPALLAGLVWGAGDSQQPAQVGPQSSPSYTVNSTLDDANGDVLDGVCDTGHVHNLQDDGHVHNHTGIQTLRACIEQGNASTTPFQISFAVPGPGPHLIQPGTALPGFTSLTTVDGTTQPGYAGAPLIEINGSNLSGGTGLATAGTVRGLAITGFGIGIFLGANGIVESSYIGIAPDGAPDSNVVGVLMDGPNGRVGGDTGTTPGGACSGACNVISGNDIGVYILTGFGDDGVNSIEGNFIGTDPGGTVAAANGVGITVRSSLNTIGGVTPGARNVISGNVTGISFEGTGTVDGQPATRTNFVHGNYIGLNAAGNAKLGNLVGIDFTGGTANVIGGDVAGTRNVISGNSTGVQIRTITGQFVSGNYIGLNAAGDGKVGNQVAGVSVLNSDNNVIGGERDSSSKERCEGPCNVISGNDGDGVLINFSPSENNFVVGNYIGLNPQGDGVLGNGGAGVKVRNAYDTVVGGTGGVSPLGPCTGVCNVISGNANRGILIEASAAGKGERTLVMGNYIGLNPTGGSTQFGNNGDAGVLIFNASNNTVGGEGVGAGNVISGNGGVGVFLSSDTSASRTSGNFVLSNVIGLGADGTTKIGNGGAGVTIGFASGNSIGSASSTAENVISSNGGDGVRIFAFSTDNVVAWNLIGLDDDGRFARGNLGAGVSIENSSNNVVGGTTDTDPSTICLGACNVISGNDDGVKISDGSSGNRVEGNYIGLDFEGDTKLGNSGNGVLILDSSSNTIGGTDANARNVISGNDGDGVELTRTDVNVSTTVQNTVLGNYIGINRDAKKPVGNGGSGVSISGAENNTIGGAASGARNVIAGNDVHGVEIIQSSNISILGNDIGRTVNPF